MKISRRIRRSKWFKKVVAACLISGIINFGFVPGALALPQGGSVQWGNIDISNPAIIKMLSGNGAIINWDNFSIANGETVRFDFDLVNNAAVLNRVVKNNPSLIAGLLEATNYGGGILVNPSGIVFQKGAQINTGQFIASTLDISDNAFKNFSNGETTLLQFRPNGGTSQGIEFTGDTYTNISNLAFIGSTISVAPGITISGGTAPAPIKDYGVIRLLAGKEVDISAYSDNYSISMNVPNHLADAGNTIKIGDATGGATIRMGGIQIQGGAINIDGSKTSRSTIYSGNNPIYDNTTSIIAISKRDGDNDIRKYTPENTVTIKNTNLNAENDRGILEVIGGKVQMADSNIKVMGALDITARSGREGDIVFADADNSVTMENVKIDVVNPNYATIFGGKVQLTDSTINTNGNINIRARSKWQSDTDFAGVDNSLTLKNVKINSVYDATIRGGKVQITNSDINSNSVVDVMALSERYNPDGINTRTTSTSDNSIILENVKLFGENSTRIRGGKVEIKNSDIITNGSPDLNLNILAYSDRETFGDSGDDTIMSAGTDNTIAIDNSSIKTNNAHTSINIRGGQVQVSDSAIESGDSLYIFAVSEMSDVGDISKIAATAGNSVNFSGTSNKMSATDGISIGANDINMSNTDIILTSTTNNALTLIAAKSGEVTGNFEKFTFKSDTDNTLNIDHSSITTDDASIRILGGKVEISDSTINSGYTNIVAANSLETNGDFSNAVYKANANNTLNIDNSSIIVTGRIRGLGGVIDINSSRIEGRGVGLAAFEELINDQRTWPHDTSFNGESSSKHGAGNSVTLRGNSSIVAASGSTIKGFSIKVDQSSIATNSEHGSSLSAVSSYVNSDSKRVQNYEADSKNIIEISNGSNLTSSNDNGQIMLLGGVINNNGTVNANNGSAVAIALWELKGSGTLEGASSVIDFSGKDMEAGEHEYILHGEKVTVTVELDNPDKPHPTFEGSWDENGKTVKTTIYLKSALSPEDIDVDTPAEEVMKSIDKVLENSATKEEALQSIETIFNHIQGKSAQEKGEIASHLMDAALQDGFDTADVAKAVIDGDGGNGTFANNLSEANNETSKENNTQQQSGETNVNGTTQLTQNNDQTASNNKISSGVSLEGEALDDN